MNNLKQIERTTLTITLAWFVIILAVASWNIWTEYNHDILERAKDAARSSFTRNTALRSWLASHGGVYVPITDNTPANPYLSHIPERDIETLSGKKLTLMNSAYAIRHFAENSKNMEATWHLTSMNLVNPDNAPDDWETSALRAFEQGAAEVFEFALFKGKPHLRLMKPLKYSERCKKCHGHMGYKDGDIRGGVGSYFPMEQSWNNFHDTVKKLLLIYLTILFLGFAVIWFFYTQQKKSAEQQDILEARLLQGQKMAAIGTMAGGIAHDFNNMLHIILGYAELIKSDTPEHSQTRENIEQVIQASNRSKSLVKQILSFSRKNDSSEKRIPLQLTPLIKEALKFQRSTIPTSIDIRADIEENNCQILGEATQIYQVIINLCTNAAQAMEKKGGIMEISLHITGLSAIDLEAEPELSPSKYVRLSVSDTGPGLTSALIDRIFDPFFTTKKVGEGCGMGLSVVHGIVKSHGGFVKIESDPGSGCTFNVFFPLHNDKVVPENAAEPEDLPRGTERILFIDDEEALANLGKNMLTRLGYHATTKQSSIEALQAFQDHPDEFDLVITDQTMPDLTGIDLAKKMLLIRPDIPIILCTGYSNLVDEKIVKAQGIKGLVFKPLGINAIAIMIRQALAGDDCNSEQI